ncbi:MAG TPA: ketoacyl-synthetase C-terminal extension domain-containing protein, partial [Streptomyces sp.]|nr:ketoacyl-synthetase C-terminal extension domain-containing protein [Streptomyces sp.]
PSAKSQAEVIGKAWQRAGLDIATAGYVETHGSGTKLGDAVEVEGLALARGESEGMLPIGSVKTNLGHLDHAAGIAGLVKAILSVRHAELYPTLHFTRPGEDVDLEAAQLDVVTSNRPWDADVRRAGVSSFSLGGINAHCVVEQPPAPATSGRGGGGRTGPAAEAQQEPRLVGLSARTETDLVLLSERLSLELRDGTTPLADVAMTLNEGRDHHLHRMGVVARNSSDLALKLAAQVTWRRIEAQQNDAPESTGNKGSSLPSAPRVVLLLSGDAEGAPAGEGAPLPARLPLPAPLSGRVRGQLAAHAWLKKAGVPVEGLFSSGASRYAVRHLQGRLSAADTRALEQAEEGPADAEVFGGPMRADRLHAAVEEQLAAGPVVFVELAARGEISDLLFRHLAGRPGARVVTLGDDPGRALEALGRLYEARLDLDWHALSISADGRRPRRVPLTGHPFRGVRCWARPMDDIIRFDGIEAAPPVPSVTGEHPPAATAPEEDHAPAVREPRPQPLPPATRPEAESRAESQAESQAGPEPEAEPQTTAPAEDDSDTAVLPWLRATLAELLYADEVPADADYFSIGGNSVIALQLIERVITRYSASLKLVDVYTHPLVADLAAAITERMPQARGSAEQQDRAR